jgi:SPX domain protein involved in polyphosphate accumulation
LLRFDFLKNELECINNKSRHFSFSNILRTRKTITDENRNIISNSNEEERSKQPWIKKFKSKQSKGIKRHRFRKINDLKLAFSEFYLMLIFLKNYQTLNYTGFCKILKKHDKLFETTRGNEWRYEYFSFFLFNNISCKLKLEYYMLIVHHFIHRIELIN